MINDIKVPISEQNQKLGLEYCTNEFCKWRLKDRIKIKFKKSKLKNTVLKRSGT